MKERILLSWYDHVLDFMGESTQINLNGPIYLIHKHYFANYSKHVILSSELDLNHDKKLKALQYHIHEHFDKDHNVTCEFLNLKDIADLTEIKSKLVHLIRSLYADQLIDIFIPIGTTSMRIAWSLIHLQGTFQTRLLTFRPPRGGHVSENTPELVFLEMEQSSLPVHIEAKERSFTPKETYEEQDNFTTEATKEAKRKALLAARTDCKVLIYGENGVGKGELAKFVHANSGRRDKPFLEVNCASLGDNLLESRLFGYAKGAFTGAEKESPGFFETAHGGTIFLDEIGEISPYMQVSLLRVLQENTILRIGENQPRSVDVRIIAATNRDLIQLVLEGKFRQDLYFRLAVVEIDLPSLRVWKVEERKKLITFLLRKMQKRYQRRYPLHLDKNLEKALLSYPFRGNIREMEHVVEYFFVMNEDKAPETIVTKEDLPKRMERLAEGNKNSLLLADVEKEHIEKVLEMFDGNLTKTQKALGLGTNTETIRKKIKKYGIDLEKFRP